MLSNSLNLRAPTPATASLLNQQLNKPVNPITHLPPPQRTRKQQCQQSAPSSSAATAATSWTPPPAAKSFSANNAAESLSVRHYPPNQSNFNSIPDKKPFGGCVIRFSNEGSHHAVCAIGIPVGAEAEEVGRADAVE